MTKQEQLYSVLQEVGNHIARARELYWGLLAEGKLSDAYELDKDIRVMMAGHAKLYREFTGEIN